MVDDPERPAPSGPPPAEAVGIYKQFGSTLALRGVSLALRSGRCLGLVGRNGAGKSTLVSIMSGIYGADRGQVLFEGERAPALGDVEAWRNRVATVFQHSMVVPQLTVAENVFLNCQPGRSGMVDWKTMRAETRRVLSEWGFDDVDAGAPCSSLSVEQRQLVEIARALAAGRRCLFLDEPTAALERSGSAGCSSACARWWPVAWRCCTSPTTWRKSSRSAMKSPSCGTVSWSSCKQPPACPRTTSWPPWSARTWLRRASCRRTAVTPPRPPSTRRRASPAWWWSTSRPPRPVAPSRCLAGGAPR